jgi:hypothetical protein
MSRIFGVPRVSAIGVTALAFTALYFLSDVIEAIQGGFCDSQLWLTLVAEAAVPFIVIGLWLVQRPQIGRLGLLSAVAYASGTRWRGSASQGSPRAPSWSLPGCATPRSRPSALHCSSAPASGLVSLRPARPDPGSAVTRTTSVAT